MASKALRNTIATFTMCGLVASLLRDTDSRTEVQAASDRVWDEIMYARKLWPACSDQEHKQVEATCEALFSAAVQGSRYRNELSNTALAMLTDLAEAIIANAKKARHRKAYRNR